MNENNHRVALRWFEEVWGKRRVETIHELFGADGVGHMEGGEITGSEAFVTVHREVLKAMPDLVMEVEDCIADGEDAVVRWTFRGTHTGCGLGCEATHREIRSGGMTWFKIRDGKIVEGWDRWNWDGFMKALQAA
jgi:steroid delta-isomerase-like uncharacterized protein